MIFTRAIEKIAASEKSMTGPSFMAEPMITKRQKMILNANCVFGASPNR